MPTGYTAKLMEKGENFQEFVMRCARAMGACVMMRDDPIDAPIPECFEPSTYHSERIEAAKSEVESLKSMSSAERKKYSAFKHTEAIISAQNWLEKRKAENERLEQMEKQIREWLPPTRDHQGLKDFMLEQISISKNDLFYWEQVLQECKDKEPMSYYQDALIRADEDVRRHAVEQDKENDLTNGRTEWVKQLRESLNHCLVK